MENNASDENEALSPEAQTAKAATLSACDRLVAAGVTFVAVHFDGYGDDGTTEDVNCYDSEWYAWGEHEPLIRRLDPNGTRDSKCSCRCWSGTKESV
jgi:hypothetical protein